MIINKIGILLSIMALIVSCTSKIEIPDDNKIGYQYFPIQQGMQRTYQSDSIIYSGGGTRIDTLTSYLQDRVGEYLTDLEGNNGYILERYFKRNLSENWSRINSWTVYRDNTRAISTEENIKFIKMIFPPTKGRTWNGNIFLDEDIRVEVGGEFIQMYRNWNSRIEEKGLTVTVNQQDYQDCVVVRLADINTVIDRRRVYETYAAGIGLISKDMIILDGDGSGSNLPWEQRAKKGFIHSLRLIEHN